MWILLLGYLFSVLFEDSVVRFFLYDFYYRIITYSGGGVGWLYHEYLRPQHGMGGAKKFTLDHDLRHRVYTQIILIGKHFCVYTHLISILELGTLSLLWGLYGSILIEHFSQQFKAVERISTNNYYILIRRKIRWIKSEFTKMRHLTLNDKIFFSALFFLFRYGFLKTYFWVDFFVLLRPLFIIFIVITILFSVFLPNYLIYNCLISNFPKNAALLIKMFTKKLILCFLFLLVFIALIVSDLDEYSVVNENFFKEFFFKITLFVVYIS